MSTYEISIRPFGVHAILMEWPQRVEEAILDDILQFTWFLEEVGLKGANWEIVPAYNSVTLIHRERPIVFEEFAKKLRDWYGRPATTRSGKRWLWRLPVCYDPEFAIDLPEVADRSGKTEDEIVRLHTSYTYTLYCIGFLPGFMYLGGLPKELEIPRKPQPRSKVAKGAVGLAGKQTGIYPQESPGGWNIIGRCPVPMFDPKKEEPCFISVGDKVQFYAIERAEYDLHKIEAEVGIYKPEKSEWDA
ncbi:5-oxoprolinase subunit PxpB [Pseudozobellia thermophila]|uniref:Sensor histidine kinase inhibitor, KipI family n=1 Tax=Pseudozobellia thermophila TaxID=192903 RepID=A0A1M6N5L1_9FLAO|nr:5-oxoprolinase subunit PxpB [Pseudozobellia thermophila]SHJ90984.1 sensor histidine kinase inhibitor, KipI family [Pseudozobellia thermophila]